MSIFDDNPNLLAQILGQMTGAQPSIPTRQPTPSQVDFPAPRPFEPPQIDPVDDDRLFPRPGTGGGGGGTGGGGGGGTQQPPNPWLQLTPTNAMTLASPHSGPQLEWGNPTLAPPMTVPQFPGIAQHDGTTGGLLAILQKQMAGGGAAGGGGSGGGGNLVMGPDGVLIPAGGVVGSAQDPFDMRGK